MGSLSISAGDTSKRLFSNVFFYVDSDRLTFVAGAAPLSLRTLAEPFADFSLYSVL